MIEEASPVLVRTLARDGVVMSGDMSETLDIAMRHVRNVADHTGQDEHTKDLADQLLIHAMNHTIDDLQSQGKYFVTPPPPPVHE